MTSENTHSIRDEINAMWEFLHDSGWLSDDFFTREKRQPGIRLREFL